MNPYESISKMISQYENIPSKYVSHVEITFVDGSVVTIYGKSITTNVVKKNIKKDVFGKDRLVDTYKVYVNLKKMYDDARYSTDILLSCSGHIPGLPLK